MKRKLEIHVNSDLFGDLLCKDIQWHYENTKKEARKVRKILKKKNSKSCDRYSQELKYLEGLLPAFRSVGAYYGIKLK